MKNVRPKLVGGLVVAAVLAWLPAVALAQGTSQDSAAGSAASAGQAGITVAADALVGTRVFDNQGREIGSINKLLIDPKDGRVASVLIKQGGAVGMGGKEISVPWTALKIQQGEKGLVATMPQPGLEPVPSASPSSERNKSEPQPQRRQ